MICSGAGASRARAAGTAQDRAHDAPLLARLFELAGGLFDKARQCLVMLGAIRQVLRRIAMGEQRLGQPGQFETPAEAVLSQVFEARNRVRAQAACAGQGFNRNIPSLAQLRQRAEQPGASLPRLCRVTGIGAGSGVSR